MIFKYLSMVLLYIFVFSIQVFFLLLQYLHFILLSLSIFIARHEIQKANFLYVKIYLANLAT